LRTRLKDRIRGEAPFQSARVRYGFAVGAAAAALAARLLIAPLTGYHDPFVLFFVATLVTTLLAGVRPGLLTLAIGTTLATVLLITPVGYATSQVLIHVVLYGLTGLFMVYLAHLTSERRLRLVEANQQLQAAHAERGRLLAHERLVREQVEFANAQLRESEERFRLTVDNAPIGMALVTLDGRFVRVNQVFCEITGYSAEELMTLTYQDITHPDDLETDAGVVGQLARGEIPRYQREKRYIRKDGAVVVVMLSASVLRGADGVPRYYVSQMEDVTKRKQAEDSLRLSEAKFSGIVSIASDAIITVDDQQRITIFNDGAEQIFGYTKQEMLGAPLDPLIPERFRAGHRAHIEGFARGAVSARPMGARREIYGLRKNGKEFPAEASISKVVVGGATFFSVVLRDVTDRKEAEAALLRAVVARDQVLGIVAHDLRNPLHTIIMQAGLLERPEPEPERRDQTPRLVIARSASRMNRLIQDLLDVALVEAGELKVERAPLSATDLARDAVESEKPLAAESGLELDLEGTGDAPKVLGDRNRLLQVFDNLIGNAIKFTPKGGRITVGVRPGENEVVFSVADTGRGISPDHTPHVFDRFWQAATRAKRLGAGLGLPITRGLVEAHGGRIWVESTVGRGSTFFFTIPTVPSGRRDPGSQ
jgi:PAS domain S-box-containing protein